MGKVIFLITSLLAITILDAPSASAQGTGPISIIRSLLENNVAGSKVVHTVQKWDFDPYIADRRRIEFEAKNGIMGANLIERLGLGEDGHVEERRRQQKARDKAAGY